VKVDQLLDVAGGCLRCTYCRAELVEESPQSQSDTSDCRSLMVRFNDEIEPIYALLRNVEDLRLSADILEPEPQDYRPLTAAARSRTGDMIRDAILMCAQKVTWVNLIYHTKPTTKKWKTGKLKCKKRIYR